MTPRLQPGGRLWVPVFFLALLGAQLRGIPSTNFGGFDEWLVLDLVSRGIVPAPYANRPFNFIWLRPASWLPHYRFESFGALFVFYGVAAATTLYGLSLRMAPQHRTRALLSAAFFLVWAPGDLARLSTIDRAHYFGITFGTLLAVALLVEAWVVQSRGLLGLGIFTAMVTAGSYEGTLALLIAAPMLLLALPDAGRRRWPWVLAWEGAVATSAAMAAAPFLGFGPRLAAYQGKVLGASVDPWALLARIGWQYVYHLFPLLNSPPRELLVSAVPTTVLIIAVAVAVSAREPEPLGSSALRAMALGLVAAGLGYSLIVVGMAAASAYRLEFLAGPGIAVFLAAMVSWLAGRVPPRWRVLVSIVLAGWVGAVGAGRTVAMQRTWDEGSAYAKQARMLRGLTAVVPDASPGTAVVVLDQGSVWKATFTFEHAVRYLYRGHVVGCVWGSWPFLYGTSFGPAGLRYEPSTEIREPWRIAARTYGYDELVVVRSTPSGQVELVTSWPAELPPLLEGARYDPSARIVRAGAPIPEQVILTGPMERAFR